MALVDQELRVLLGSSGVARDLGDDRVRHPDIVAVILNNNRWAHLRCWICRAKVNDYDIASHLRSW